MNPNDIEELVTLDRILKDNGFTVTVYDLPKTQAQQYGCEYSYSVLTQKGKLGKTFEEAAEKLVAAADGKITASSKSGGFVALFGADEKCMDFLKAFSKAAAALSPQPEGIAMTGDGFVLGVKPRRGLF